MSSSITGGPVRFATWLYRIFAAIWLSYSTGLLLVASGSTLLRAAEAARWVVIVLSAVVMLAMATRIATARRPHLTAWALPLMSGVSLTTFLLVLLAADATGDISTIRVGIAVLTLTPGFLALFHYFAEKAVAAQ